MAVYLTTPCIHLVKPQITVGFKTAKIQRHSLDLLTIDKGHTQLSLLVTAYDP